MILAWQNRIAARGGEIQSRLLTKRYRQNGRVRRSADEEECGQMLRGVGAGGWRCQRTRWWQRIATLRDALPEEVGSLLGSAGGRRDVQSGELA